MISILNNNVRRKPASRQTPINPVEKFPALIRENKENTFKESNFATASADCLSAEILTGEFNHLLSHLKKVSLSAGQELYAPDEKSDCVCFHETLRNHYKIEGMKHKEATIFTVSKSEVLIGGKMVPPKTSRQRQ